MYSSWPAAPPRWSGWPTSPDGLYRRRGSIRSRCRRPRHQGLDSGGWRARRGGSARADRRLTAESALRVRVHSVFPCRHRHPSKRRSMMVISRLGRSPRWTRFAPDQAASGWGSHDGLLPGRFRAVAWGARGGLELPEDAGDHDAGLEQQAAFEDLLPPEADRDRAGGRGASRRGRCRGRGCRRRRRLDPPEVDSAARRAVRRILLVRRSIAQGSNTYRPPAIATTCAQRPSSARDRFPSCAAGGTLSRWDTAGPAAAAVERRPARARTGPTRSRRIGSLASQLQFEDGYLRRKTRYLVDGKMVVGA
jgi:hypothetical protein